MPYRRFEAPFRQRLIGALLLAGLAAGCASTGPVTEVSEKSPEPEDVPRPKVEVDGEYGFTVTEVIQIGSEVRADYQEAVVLLQQERLEEGISRLERVVESAPSLTAPHIDLGVAYGRLSRYEEAKKSLETALSLAPDHPVALNELGIIYRKTGQFDAARHSYERALGIQPSYHLALRNLGVLCDIYLADLQCALASYESYAQIVKDDPEVGIWIADLRNRLGTIE